MAEQSRYKKLLEVVKLLNASLDFDKTKAVIMEQAKAVFKAEASSLIFLDKEKDELYFDVATGEKGEKIKEIRFPADKGIAGWIIQNRKPLLVEDVSADPRFFQGVDKKSEFVTKSIIGVPVWINGEVIGLIEVLNKTDGGAFSSRDLKLLQTFADLAALNLKNAMWHKDTLDKERMEADLRIAGEIQERLLPRDDISIEGYRYVARYRACRSVGGDYYDVLPFGEDQVLFVIADVSGKGAPAALVMSTLRAYLHSAVRFKMSLGDIVTQLNTSIFRDTEAQRFVTLILGKLDKKAHRIEYVNAGHNYPALLSEKRDVRFLESNDIPLGILEEYDFSLHTLQLDSKETLVLYTDGITESMDSRENLYGEEAFVKDLEKGPGESLEIFSQALFDRAFHFAEGKQTDDMTLLLFRRE